MEFLTPGKALRQAIQNACIQVPGAPHALAARLIERYGFPAMYLSGEAMSASVLALPDVGLFTLTELVEQTRRIASAANVPLIVDAAAGFGEAIHVERTVSELELAGAAAIQLDDRQLPKRCGQLSGKTLVPAEQMCEKLRAATSARADEDLVIIARTDARDAEDFESAVTRARSYRDAGADWIFPEALEREDEFRRFAKEVDAPLVANMTEFGNSPLLTFETLEETGYSAVLYPLTLLRVAIRAMEVALATLGTDGTQEELLDLMQTHDELNDLLDYEDFQERDREHFGRADG